MIVQKSEAADAENLPVVAEHVQPLHVVEDQVPIKKNRQSSHAETQKNHLNPHPGATRKIPLSHRVAENRTVAQKTSHRKDPRAEETSEVVQSKQDFHRAAKSQRVVQAGRFLVHAMTVTTQNVRQDFQGIKNHHAPTVTIARLAGRRMNRHAANDRVHAMIVTIQQEHPVQAISENVQRIQAFYPVVKDHARAMTVTIHKLQKKANQDALSFLIKKIVAIKRNSFRN